LIVGKGNVILVSYPFNNNIQHNQYSLILEQMTLITTVTNYCIYYLAVHMTKASNAYALKE